MKTEWTIAGEAESYLDDPKLGNEIIRYRDKSFFPMMYVKTYVTVNGKRCVFYVCSNAFVESQEQVRVICIDKNATHEHLEYVEKCMEEIIAKAVKKFKCFDGYFVIANP